MRGRRLSVLLAVEAAALSAFWATAPAGQTDSRRQPTGAPDGSTSVRMHVVPAPHPGQAATAENDSESNISGDIDSGGHSSSHTRNEHARHEDHGGRHPGHGSAQVGPDPNGGGQLSRSGARPGPGHGRTGHGFLPFTGDNATAGVVTGTTAALLGAALVWLTRRRRRRSH